MYLFIFKFVLHITDPLSVGFSILFFTLFWFSPPADYFFYSLFTCLAGENNNEAKQSKSLLSGLKSQNVNIQDEMSKL